MALAAIAFCAGLNPFVAVVMLGVVAGAGRGPEVGSQFAFATEWPFLIPMLLLLGVDVVIDKLPTTAGLWARPALLLRVVAGGLVGGMLGEASLGMALAIVVGAALALVAGGMRWIAVGRLGRRFYGLERFIVGASTDSMAVLAVLATLFSAAAGLALTAGSAGVGIYLLRRVAVEPSPD
ncbi:MAG: DUF4126 family protein [Chloroflexota bacterium]|jgi:hypothetical protein|nr:DUF4126 family protein [Chloroflexota bacterium]MDP6756647.1 DUF4126 family protein [Chloroflexota bacterium]